MELDSNAARPAESRSAARSCTTCSKAKAKCVRASGQQVCERCTRLSKECFSREPLMRKRKIVKPTRSAQLEKLENKIEHLVNALSTSQAAQRRLQDDRGHVLPQGIPDDVMARRTSGQVLNSLCNGPEDAEESDCAAGSNGPSPSSMTQQTPNSLSRMASQAESTDYSSLGVTFSEAEILLDRFRRLMAPACPFVIVSSEVTAHQLYEQKPLLLHAIVTVTYFHDLAKQQSMVKQLMRDISERILINNEKNIGILQGLLIFVAWYHPHIFWGQQVTNLLHLAIALTIDMGIDRPPGQCQDFKSATTKAVHGPSMLQRVPSNEERRALAGVFYLTSVLASSFKKIDALDYSKYLDDSMNVLEQSREFESDLFLAQIVRLQHLAEETHSAESPSAPMQIYVRAFKADLDKLKALDQCKEQNVYLRMQYLAAEILVWEMSLNDLLETKAKPLRTHLENLYSCIEAIKAFIDVYFSIPVNYYLTMPFSAFGHFAHAFIALTRLASLEIEGWDMRALTGTLNFATVIEEAAIRFDGATKSSPDGLQVNNEVFGKWAARVRWMKQVYEAKFIQPEGPGGVVEGHEALGSFMREPGGYSAETPGAISGAQQPTPPDDVLSGDFFNYLDENFWSSFGTDAELGFPDMAV